MSLLKGSSASLAGEVVALIAFDKGDRPVVLPFETDGFLLSGDSRKDDGAGGAPVGWVALVGEGMVVRVGE